MTALEKMSVLVVDDQKPSRDLLKMVLSELGVKWIIATHDGTSALQVIRERNLDIVICDWEMPNMSGYELLKQVRETDPDLPFIMVTGRADRDSVVAAKQSGVTDYIAKPLSPVKLSDKVTRLARAANHLPPKNQSVTWD